MVIGLSGSTSTPQNSLLPSLTKPQRDLRFRRDVFLPRLLGRHPPGGHSPRSCRICGCSDKDPCAGGCGWSQTPPGHLPLCLACADFARELEAYVEDGRVTKGGVVRLYREARVRIQARRLAEMKEIPEAPRFVRRVAAGGR
jgi:hypothetical protein